MMIVDLLDELDIIEGIHKQVPDLTKSQDIKPLLEAARDTANQEQWQQLDLWLVTVSKDMSILLPEIKHALCSGWQGDREISSELQHNLEQ